MLNIMTEKKEKLSRGNWFGEKKQLSTFIGEKKSSIWKILVSDFRGSNK